MYIPCDLRIIRQSLLELGSRINKICIDGGLLGGYGLWDPLEIRWGVRYCSYSDPEVGIRLGNRIGRNGEGGEELQLA